MAGGGRGEGEQDVGRAPKSAVLARPGRLRAPVPVWLATRGVVALATVVPASVRPRLTGDPALYLGWARLVAHGSFPLHDPQWQYPPGAAALLLVPLLARGHYLFGLVVLLLALDAASAVALARRGRREAGSARGLWAWLLLLPCVGPVVLARFDLAPAAAAVLAASVSPAALVGACVAIGALVKLWPAVLAGLALKRGRRLGAVAGAAAVTGLLAVGLAADAVLADSLRSFAAHQSSRGLQVESLAAYPVMVAATLRGRSPGVTYRDGSLELVGHAGAAHVAAVLAALMLVLSIAAVVWAGVLRRPDAELLDLAFAGVLVTMLCAEVLSPQYLVWLVALAAAAASRRASRGGAVLPLLAVAALLTTAVFPYLYGGYLGGAVLPVALEGARDLTLLVAAVLALRAVRWSELTRRADPGEPAGPRRIAPTAWVPAGAGAQRWRGRFHRAASSSRREGSH